jgi:hypothetical protein
MNLRVTREELGKVGKERLMSHRDSLTLEDTIVNFFALCSKRDSHPKPAWPSDEQSSITSKLNFRL